MTLKNLFILLLCAIFLPNISFQNDERRSIASINVTAGYAGEALTLRCEVPDVKLDDGKLEVYFQIDIDTRINNLAEYRISGIFKFI